MITKTTTFAKIRWIQTFLSVAFMLSINQLKIRTDAYPSQLRYL